MSLTVIKEGDGLKILDGDLPTSEPVKVYTEDEVKQMEAWAAWMSISEAQRQEMMLQTQSTEYAEWMDEEEWDESKVMEAAPNPYGTASEQAGDSE